jgi:uncharacterized circularly permuted ATP-grasp superfamily protein
MQRIVDRLAKWKMHQFFAQNPQISSFLPPSALLTPTSLVTFIDRYNTVYIKANTIHTGRGIVKAWKNRNGYQYVRVRGKVQNSPSANHLFKKVKEISLHELFIVQKGIDLATINGRPYDIRVMMMRDGARKWQFAGMLAKVHGPLSIVSNIKRGGGYVIDVESALAQSNFDKVQIRRIKNQLIELSRKIIQYSDKYPFYSFQSGIDLAVDKSGSVWIIEVNLHNPSHGLFKQLKNKTYYNQVLRLYRDYRKNNTRLI